MRTQLTGAILALLTAAPGVLMAQSSTDSSSSSSSRAERYRVRERQAPRMTQLTMVMGHPRLGLTLSSDSSKGGAVVEDVMEDSPAEKAGFRQGDVITRLNGTALSGDDPAGTLSELAGKLEPGDTVKVEYKRDGASKSATMVAADMGARSWTMKMPEMAQLERLRTDMPPMAWSGPGNEMSRAFTVMGRGAMGLDLVEMNSGLGEYFGTSSGLLVTETPSDSTMPLRAGDVILTIGGRTPNNEMHASRILGSYAPGETVKFEIMRKKNRQTVSWTVPEREQMRMLRPMRRGMKLEKS
jgi:S1-C subfamily serine protease